MNDEQAAWPPTQRDRAPNELVEEPTIVFQLQTRERTGPWNDYQTPVGNRDVLTRVQAYRIKAFPKEQQRVLRHVVATYVDEVVGDGPDETSAADLLLRNDAITEHLLAEEKKAQQLSE